MILKCGILAYRENIKIRENGGTVKISLTCVTSVLAGFAAAGTMLGAIVGGLGIACGCDDELDSLFGTNFRRACS